MKRMFFYAAIGCISLWATGCNKEKPGSDTSNPNEKVSLKKGTVLINDNPKVSIQNDMDQYPRRSETPDNIDSQTPSAIKRASMFVQCGDPLVHDYRFKLVAWIKTMTINSDIETPEGKDYTVQASHVKVSDDGFIFVAFNTQSRYEYQTKANIGGLVVFKYAVTGGVSNPSVTVTPVSSIEMPDAQINAVDFYNNKLYIAGASSSKQASDFFGKDYKEENGGSFLMVMTTEPGTKKFKAEEPVVIQLTSYQATSVKYYDDRVYITTGDGTGAAKGGLYVYDANSYERKSFVEKQYARSVDVDKSGVYIMQANHARVTKYDYPEAAGAGTPLHNAQGEAMQPDAKSDIFAWNDYLFVSENETGLKMIFKDGNGVYASLQPPNRDKPDCEDGADNPSVDCWFCEEDVTNSLTINNDITYGEGTEKEKVNLLMVANGRMGLYWYGIVKDACGQYYVKSNGENRIHLEQTEKGGSANFVASKGNVAFVADGLEGLKILYVDINPGEIDDDNKLPKGCTSFMDYVFDGTTSTSMMFPEGKSVLRSDASVLVKQLFQLPTPAQAAAVTLDRIDILEDTELYLTFLSEVTSASNTLGYFVIPANSATARTKEAEFEYWKYQIKPNWCTVAGSVNVLKDEYIIIKNMKAVYKNGQWQTGSGKTFQIGGENKVFKKNDRVILFMAPNGWNAQSNRVEITYTANTSKHPFFMHKFFNGPLGNNLTYNAIYGDFRGIQINSFYSIDCNSVILCFEDGRINSDIDFNDAIVSISDNLENKKITKFTLPKWAFGRDGDGTLKIIESKDL